jgi:hypothetical protein
MTFRRSGEVGGGAKWIQPPPQFHIAYNPITQPSTQHYPRLEHVTLQSTGHAAELKAIPKGITL